MTFAARWVSDELAGPHLLLAVATRSGASLITHCAWRLFPDLLPRVIPAGARALLTILTERFGAKLHIPGLGRDKLLYWREQTNSRSVEIGSQRDTLRYFLHQFSASPESGKIEVIVAFCIELKRYALYLQLHHSLPKDYAF